MCSTGITIEDGEASGGVDGYVYLIHFNKPIAHAQHYLGFTTDLAKRFERHEAGKGSALIAEAVRRGIDFKLVRVWQGDGNFERKLKNRKNGRKLCPICTK